MRRFWGVTLGWCTVWSAHNLGSRNTGLLIKILMKLCVHSASLFFLSHPWSPAECITRNRYCYTVKRSGLQNELSHSGRRKKTLPLPFIKPVPKKFTDWAVPFHKFHDHKLAEVWNLCFIAHLNVISVLKNIENVLALSDVNYWYILFMYIIIPYLMITMDKLQLIPWSTDFENLISHVTSEEMSLPFPEPKGSLVTVILKYLIIATFCKVSLGYLYITILFWSMDLRHEHIQLCVYL